MERKLKIAFVCVHNSCRSQIAEALGKKFMSDRYDFYSCGTELKPQINQDAVRLIKDMYQIDMEQNQYSKLVQDIPQVDIAISMGCNVTCPYVGKSFDDNWNLDDKVCRTGIFLGVEPEYHRANIKCVFSSELKMRRNREENKKIKLLNKMSL